MFDLRCSMMYPLSRLHGFCCHSSGTVSSEGPSCHVHSCRYSSGLCPWSWLCLFEKNHGQLSQELKQPPVVVCSKSLPGPFARCRSHPSAHQTSAISWESAPCVPCEHLRKHAKGHLDVAVELYVVTLCCKLVMALNLFRRIQDPCRLWKACKHALF